MIGSNVRVASASTGTGFVGKVASLGGDRLSVLMPESVAMPKENEVWLEAFAPGLELQGHAVRLFSEGRLEFFRLGSATRILETDIHLQVCEQCLTGQVDNQVFVVTALGPNGFGYASGSTLSGEDAVPVLVRSPSGTMCVRATSAGEHVFAGIHRGWARLAPMSSDESSQWRHLCVEGGKVSRRLFSSSDVALRRAA
jgi:hypothetical protein